MEEESKSEPSSPSTHKKIKLNEENNVEEDTNKVMEESQTQVLIEEKDSKSKPPFKSPKTDPVLAPETWDRIFCDTHSKDFVSVINSAPEWNQILHSRKISELFPMILPFVMRYLPKPDFLNTRLISRHWKQSADSVYENHPSRLATLRSTLKFPKLTSRGKLMPQVDNGIKLRGIDTFKKFTTEMSLDSGNPFPGRCVWLQIRRQEEEDFDENITVNYDEDAWNIVLNPDPINGEEYWTSLIELLTQFGEFIWYLKLEYYFYDLDDSSVESRLRNILLLMPNLKKLQLSMGDNEDCHQDPDWLTFNNRAIESFGADADPPPKLNQLQMFSYGSEDCDDECAPLVIQLLKSYCAGGMMKRLELASMSYNDPVPLPELIELETLMDYKKVPELKEASPKLEKLTIHFQYQYGGRHEPSDDESDYDNGDDSDENHEEEYDEEAEFYDCNIATIFEGLHLFGDSLKELNIEDNAITSNKKRSYFKVQLPKLERLCFKYDLPIHHLEELKALKILRIEGSRYFGDKKYCADIFQKLPNLKKVIHVNDRNAFVQTK